MNELKPTECTVYLPWGFSEASDKARKTHCAACAGTGLVYAIPDTHRVVSVERLRGIQSAFYNAADDVLGWGAYADAYFQDKHGLEDQALVYKLMAESLSAIIDNKEPHNE